MATANNHSALNGALVGIGALFAAVLGVLTFSGIVSAAASDCHDHYDLIAFVFIVVIAVIMLGIAYLGHIGKEK